MGGIPLFAAPHFSSQGTIDATLEKKLSRRFPRIALLGNYLKGAAVEDCLNVAKEKATATIPELLSK